MADHSTREDALGTTTLEDVARISGVSAKTVSRVVNGEQSVRRETRERVLRAIAELDYRPNLFARGLSGAGSYAVGLVYNNPNAYYIIAAQEGALNACDELGFGLLIHPYAVQGPALADKLRDFASRSRLAGLVLTQPISESRTTLRKLSAYKVPFVRITSATDDPRDHFPCVYVDDCSAAYDITQHLIQLGHVRIGFLRGGKLHRATTERFKGYRTALHDYRIPLRRELIFDGDYTFDDGFRGARRLLSLDNPPTAIFGSNDEIAAGVLAAVRSLHLHVPYDVSIAGFEDSPFSRHSWPPITTARQRAEAIIGHATRMLIGMVRGAKVGNAGFRPELVVRGSTAPPRPRT